MNKSVVIVAGGSGSRMGSVIPKQFLELGTLPIIFITINRFLSFDPNIEIVVVLPPDYIDIWEDYVIKYNFNIENIKIAKGGRTRYHSVKNGISMLSDKVEYVAVHDAVRPLVSSDLINRCFEDIKKGIGIVPAVTVVDSLRMGTDKQSTSVDRTLYKSVQTPQCFILKELKESYKGRFSKLYTDDASVFEHWGGKVMLVEGEVTNIKITSPIDMIIANEIMINHCKL